MRSPQTPWRLAALLLLGGAAVAPPARADESAAATGSPSTAVAREPCASRDPLRQPFFGDTHVHTAFSLDAASQDTRNRPRDAYRFARGEPLGIQPYDREGRPLRSVRIDRPLDFAAVTDHAEQLGEVRICNDPDATGGDSDMCWAWRRLPPVSMGLMMMRSLIERSRFQFCGEDGALCLAAAREVWGEIRGAAEEAYDRSAACSFTSFVGYEWTASVGNGKNLHRNVIFRSARVPELPPSWLETPSAFALWEHLERACSDGLAGCDALTIPHNSNLSAGLLFASARLESAEDASRPVDREEAERRQRFEPLVEIMQHKGDSECLPGGPARDEACGFEKLPYNSFGGVQRFQQISGGGLPEALRPVRADSVRAALGRGLREEARLGVNPLKYGVIASTDTHLGTPGLSAEKGHAGHGGAGMAAGSGVPVGLPDDIEFNPGGLAVVWAEENTREALFDAMRRRETYGTSGTRPVLRFFGGFDLADDACERRDLVQHGYEAGVPMGGDLPAPPGSGTAPRFAVSALADPGTPELPGAPLQRVQIVKGWLEDGASRERVVDVAGGDTGAGVDLPTCERRGEGHGELCAVWTDDDFDPAERAFYYARVLENPSCRWSQHLCVDAGVDCGRPESVPPGFAACCDEEVPRVVQERAWTSPIWYSPGS